MQEWKESVGFLCRWCLLVLAGAAAVLAAWVGVLGSASAAAGLKSDLVVPDALWGRQKDAHLTGYAVPKPPRGNSELVMCSSPKSKLIIAPTYGGRIYPQLRAAEVGANRLSIRGVPYSRYAFDKAEAVIQVVPLRRDACLLDAGTVLKAESSDREAFRACLGELQKRHEVAFFHAGQLHEFLAVRRRLRQGYPSVPVIFSLDRRYQPNTLNQTAWTLKRHKDDKPRPMIVTGDSSMAAGIAPGGFTVHLVGPPEGGDEAGGQIRVHRSFAKFKEYLATQPIRH